LYYIYIISYITLLHYIYIPPLTRKPEQQRFTMQSGVLTSISSRQCSAISGHSRKDFGPAVCSWTNPPVVNAFILQCCFNNAWFNFMQHYRTFCQFNQRSYATYMCLGLHISLKITPRL